MKLGLLVEAEEGLDWKQWRATVAAAERLGFESLWISDHLASPWAAERHGLDAWVALSVAAAETSRLRLGTLVSPITFRAPALMARMAEALAALSGGRFVLGVGLGWNAAEHHAAGIPFPGGPERSRRLAAGLERIRQMLVPPAPRVPLLIGGSGPRLTLPLVARYADEWNLTTASVETYQSHSAKLAEACSIVDRDPRDIRRSVACGLLIGRDGDDLAARSRRMQRVVPPLAEASGGDIALKARELGWLTGTPRDVVAHLEPLRQAGVDLAILGHYDLADEGALELVANDVMPKLA